MFGKEMAVKGILFDKDGTLIDFFEVWGKAIDPVLDQLMAFYHVTGSQDIKGKIKKKLGIQGTKIEPEGALAWKPYNLIAADLAHFFNEQDLTRLTQYLKKLFYDEIAVKRESYPVFTDIKQLMKGLQKAGIDIGIATTDEEVSTKICLQKLGIDSFISFYGTAGNNMPVKPDRRLIEMAASSWQIKNNEIAVVGDTPNDMRFAENAGAISIAVLSGTGQKEDLEPLADYVINSVDELLPLVCRINQKEKKHG